jgi:hypothetical protein
MKSMFYEHQHCLLTGGMPGGDVEQLLRGLQLITVELMHQGLAVHARPEC